MLSKTIVVNCIDPQNVFTAIKFFSKPDEEFMVHKGFSTTVEFIRIVENWFEACKKRGIQGCCTQSSISTQHACLSNKGHRL